MISILQEHEACTKYADLCRTNGMPDGTLHAWKAKYSDEWQVRRIRALTCKRQNEHQANSVPPQTCLGNAPISDLKQMAILVNPAPST
ncbi:transposase [Frigidibacter sp. MR17.14]|uniref:transposase n=1 Tax=Frigidibacter sp. MR17.14 TaxID=3126509 RepID=UPI003FA5F7AE